MAELTIDGKKLIEETLTLSIRMPRAFGLRNWLTLRLISLAWSVSAIPVEVKLINNAEDQAHAN